MARQLYHAVCTPYGEAPQATTTSHNLAPAAAPAKQALFDAGEACYPADGIEPKVRRMRDGCWQPAPGGCRPALFGGALGLLRTAGAWQALVHCATHGHRPAQHQSELSRLRACWPAPLHTGIFEAACRRALCGGLREQPNGGLCCIASRSARMEGGRRRRPLGVAAWQWCAAV